jgi:Regulator of ribonuclease activity B
MERTAETVTVTRVPGARHFIYAPARAEAEEICSVLEREGWETAIDEGDDVALVTASCLRVLTGPLVRETRAHLAALASQHGGSYDGWDEDGR